MLIISIQEIPRLMKFFYEQLPIITTLLSQTPTRAPLCSLHENLRNFYWWVAFSIRWDINDILVARIATEEVSELLKNVSVVLWSFEPADWSSEISFIKFWVRIFRNSDRYLTGAMKCLLIADQIDVVISTGVTRNTNFLSDSVTFLLYCLRDPMGIPKLYVE